MKETLVFIDGAFVSKLSKHFGNGKHLKLDLVKLAKQFSEKNNLSCKHLFYYTAPPFQSDKPTASEIKMKKGYDKFINALNKDETVTIRQGRCQKIQEDGNQKYSQKGVDALMVSGMISVPIKFPAIKKILLITSDTDFCPIIKDIEEVGVEIILCTYYEKKRKSKFSVSHHLIDCCKNIYYITKKDFKACTLKKTGETNDNTNIK